MASEEIKPLLRSPYQESRDLLSETSESSETSLTSQILVTSVDEFPPPAYTSISGGGHPFIYCKVCQSMINISGKDDHFVVKCLCCNEATPIRKAPAGKKYVRCPCNCLLIAKQKSVRISCPRLTCNKILIVNSQRRRRTDEFSNWPGLSQIICVHCDDTFGFDIRNDCAARCPHCRKVSSVEQTMKIRAKYFFITAFALFLLTTGLTIGTYFIGDKELVTTCIFWLGLIFTVAVSLRGLYLYCLPQSSIENDV